MALMELIDFSGDSDTLVFVGDYIDRGPYSYEVVMELMKMQKEYGEDRVICLKGNHEQMAVDAYKTHDKDLWYQNGGMMTEYSFDSHGSCVWDYYGWLKNLPLIYETPEIIFCHAGLTELLLEDNTESDILWGRDWIENPQIREQQVIFGHTPRWDRKAYQVKNGDICIDAGCVHNGSLCACIICDDGTTAFEYAEKSADDCW